MLSVELLIVMLPLIGAFLGGIINHKVFSQFITTALLVCSAAMSWYLFFSVNESYNINLFPWIEIGKLKIYWSLYIDSLTKIMLIVVTTVSAVVHLYSIGYMSGDSGVARFFSYLSLFTFCMLMLVTSSNFLQLFFGWEGVGLCSYLLIGFWFEKFSACKAAIKAFVVNRVGDFFFLLGMLMVFWLFGSLNFLQVFDLAKLNETWDIIDVFGYQIHSIHIVCILLFIGCMGKSAQLGLHTWLPDAMEGPTPVSALIHAATMVTAGVFLVARCSPLFELSFLSREIIIIVGACTCFFAATVAVVQTDIKKIIAYSTCSQLGYMFIACGSSAYNVAVFHLMTHAFFKALLFLCAGNVIHSMHGQQNIFKMGGCWRKIPFTYVLMWIGSLALAGVFPFAGFYSKDLIIESAYHNDTFAFIMSNIVVFLTSFYSWRLLIIVFHGPETKNPIHESSKIMLLPLLILAIGSIFSGIWGENILAISDSSFWSGSIKVAAHEEVGIFVKSLPTILSGLGIAVAYLVYYVHYFKDIKLKFLLRFLYNKWYFDEIYHYAFVKPLKYIADFFWQSIDVKVIDYFGPGGVTRFVASCAKNSVKVQTGLIFDYAFVMLLGLIIVVFWIIYRAVF